MGSGLSETIAFEGVSLESSGSSITDLSRVKLESSVEVSKIDVSGISLKRIGFS